jgi:hypothetical protein
MMKRFELGTDGQREHLFRPLDEEDARLADAMRRRFTTRWPEVSGLPNSRVAEAMETVDIRMGPGDRPGARCLRITSTFTGSTRWLYEWQGEQGQALGFADDVAVEEGHWVHDERRHHGPDRVGRGSGPRVACRHVGGPPRC